MRQPVKYRCVVPSSAAGRWLTEGRVYEAKGPERRGLVKITDDTGTVRRFDRLRFKLVEETEEKA